MIENLKLLIAINKDHKLKLEAAELVKRGELIILMQEVFKVLKCQWEDNPNKDLKVNMGDLKRMMTECQ